MADGKLVFNGIDGETGGYAVPPLSLDDLAAAARREKVSADKVRELQARADLKKNQPYALRYGRDPKKIEESGWGVILPADADAKLAAAILDAIKPLRDWRRGQAGGLYKEYVGGDGYRRGEGKDTFLARPPRSHGPGPVDPERVPYYLLIVGDPESIPFEFQYELDVAFAVGRLDFRTLDEYRRYAETVVAAEQGKLVRPRAATFFGTKNKNDEATRLSAEKLIAPLGEAAAKGGWKDGDWAVRTVAPAEATKAALGKLLGGTDTPALLFTASHGAVYRNGHPRQLSDHGALLCQEWPGPYTGPLNPDHYFAAADLADGACPAGLIACFFACYGAGTPYYDAFPTSPSLRDQVAPRAFLAALPTRLLGHPGGGALAVVGHVERAWGDSIAWGRNEVDQTLAFAELIEKLRDDYPVGAALEAVNARYAQIAADLANAVHEDQYTPPERRDSATLARLWTGTHDARGYAVVGDPAVRLAVPKGKPPAPKATQPPAQPERITVAPFGGDRLSDILDPGAGPPDRAAAPVVPGGLPGGTPGGLPGGVQYGVLGDVKDALGSALRQFGEKLNQFAENVTTLEVVTFTCDGADTIPAGKPADVFNAAKVRAVTQVALSGQTRVCVPTAGGKIDDALWQVHLATVKEAQEYRTAMFKTAADVLAGLLGRGG